MEITLTKQNFEAEVLQSDKPVLVDFWAPWCGPCRMLAPAVAQIAEEYEGKAKVCKVNVDDEPELAARFGISGIPTVLGALLGYWLGEIGPLGLTLSLGFASGAMLYVVFGEILPQAFIMYRSKLPAFSAIIGILAGILIIFG